MAEERNRFAPAQADSSGWPFQSGRFSVHSFSRPFITPLFPPGLKTGSSGEHPPRSGYTVLFHGKIPSLNPPGCLSVTTKAVDTMKTPAPGGNETVYSARGVQERPFLSPLFKTPSRQNGCHRQRAPAKTTGKINRPITRANAPERPSAKERVFSTSRPRSFRPDTAEPKENAIFCIRKRDCVTLSRRSPSVSHPQEETASRRPTTCRI